MGLLKIASVIPAPRLRFETINDHGIAWPVTSYSGYVVLVPDPQFRGAVSADTLEPVAFIVPDALPAAAPPKAPVVVHTSVRSIRSRPNSGVVHIGAYEPRVDFLPDPSGGNLRPQLTFQAPVTGVVRVEINYQIVVEDS